jgi:hypothetical protein
MMAFSPQKTNRHWRRPSVTMQFSFDRRYQLFEQIAGQASLRYLKKKFLSPWL